MGELFRKWLTHTAVVLCGCHLYRVAWAIARSDERNIQIDVMSYCIHFTLRQQP